MSEESDAVERTRGLFEEVVFRKYFVSRVARDLTLKGQVADKAELVKRKKNGQYKRQEIAAMWYGWKLRLEQEAMLRKADTGNPTST